MSGEATAATEKYLYAIGPWPEERVFGPFGIGGALVYTIPGGGLAAVVSDLKRGRIRPERRNLAAHQDTLKHLMEECSVLPMSFGVVGDNRSAIESILATNRDAFAGQLRRVAGKVEMGLRVAWDVPDIFQYFVLTHSQLRAARDRLAAAGREPTQEEKIELGALFDRSLSDDREAHTETVESALAPVCAEIKGGKCRDERDVMSLNCLVDRKALPRFEAAILSAASHFDNHFAFDYSGPWAPHNFVDVDLRL